MLFIIIKVAGAKIGALDVAGQSLGNMILLAAIQCIIDQIKPHNHMDINNSIREDYCSFEVSKLLKEKGFRVPVISCFDDDDGCIIASYSNGVFDPKNYNINGSHKASRVSHGLAIKWIRENFGIIINPVYLWLDKYWGYEIYTGTHNHDEIEEYKTLEEATEAALLYTLNNLI